MNAVFLELTVVLILAGAIAVLVSFLRQPSIIAYIIAGLIIGPFGYNKLQQGELLNGLAEIGITLLLFMIGLELDFSQLKRIGKTVIGVGIAQVILTTLAGFVVTQFLGFSTLSSLYIALAVTFSSTIIVVKLLGEKKDLQSLYGKLAIGIFLVQDFVALLLLIFLSSFSKETGQGAIGIFSGLGVFETLFLTVVKATALGLIIYWHSKYLFPKVMRYIGKSDELLLIFSLAWALGLAALVSLPAIGFSLEVGGFLAGLALANSAVHYEIGARIKSLRDFFIILFFIALGANVVISDGMSLLIPVIVISILVLVVKPLIVLSLLAYKGYKPRTSFLTGVTVGQISEFSLILMAVALKLGDVGQTEVTLVTIVGIISIALSSYGILHGEFLAEKLKIFLDLFDFKKGIAEKSNHDTVFKNHIVLVGAHRLGQHIAMSLGKQHNKLIIVDHNPEVIEDFLQKGVIGICGDITDPHIQEVANITQAKLIISTVPKLHDNLSIIENIRGQNKRVKIISIAEDEEEATILYKHGVDYALLPHFIGGQHLARLLKEEDHLKHLKKLKEHHLKLLGI